MADEMQRDPVTLAYGPVGYVPEVSIFQAQPDAGLWDTSGGEYHSERPPPFWAFAWPGGQIVARYLLDHPDAVANRRVLDIGSGSGLVAISAALAGAASVRALESDPDAVAAIRRNAGANGVHVDASLGDLLTDTRLADTRLADTRLADTRLASTRLTGARLAGDDVDGHADTLAAVDVLLAGDMFYNESLAGRMMRFVRRAEQAGIRVLVGDANRGFLPADRFTALATDSIPVRPAVEGVEAVRATVWELRPLGTCRTPVSR